MTPEQAKELLPVIQAFSEGKEVQWSDTEGEPIWSDASNPSFSYRMQWRIKPDPHKTRVDWIYKALDLVDKLQDRHATVTEYGNIRGDLEEMLRNHPDTPEESK